MFHDKTVQLFLKAAHMKEFVYYIFGSVGDKLQRSSKIMFYILKAIFLQITEIFLKIRVILVKQFLIFLI